MARDEEEKRKEKERMEMEKLENQLDNLKSQGFLLVKGALETEVVNSWRSILYDMYEHGQYEIHNSVGNVAFEKLLELQQILTQMKSTVWLG